MDGLAAGVDHAVADGGIVGPVGNQPPAKPLEVPKAIGVLADAQHLLGGGDVVALGEILGRLGQGEAESLDQGLELDELRIASALSAPPKT